MQAVQPPLTTNSIIKRYHRHLISQASWSFSSDAKARLAAKLRLIQQLQSSGLNSAQDIATWLQTPYQNKNAPSESQLTHAQFLSQRRTPGILIGLQITIILLSFPVSLPILSIVSGARRQTYQFWRTSGDLFIERLQTALRTQLAITDNDASSLEAPVSASVSTQLQQLHTAPLALTATPDNQATVLPQAQKAATVSQDSNLGGLSATLDRSRALAIQTGVPAILQSNISFSPATETEQHDTFSLNLIYELRHTEPTLRPDLYTPEQLEQLAREIPELNLSENLRRHLSIRVFASLPPKRPHYPNAPADILRPPHPAVAVPITASPSLFGRLFSTNRPHPPEATINDLVSQGVANAVGNPIESVMPLFNKAFEKAKNNTDITYILEKLILVHVAKYKALAMEFNRRTRTKDKEELDGLLMTIHRYVNELPDQYWLLSESISTLQSDLVRIAKMIEQNQIKQAFLYYKAITVPPYIEYMAPYLIAWQQQFLIVFTIFKMVTHPEHFFFEFSYPTDIARRIRQVQEFLIGNGYTVEARYFDRETVQPFKALTDEWYTVEEVARKNFGSKKDPDPRLLYPILPPSFSDYTPDDSDSASALRP